MGEVARGGGCCPPMDLFRSEPMQLIQLIIPMESAHCTVSYLGDLGLLQFKDLNSEKSPFQRTYAAQIKRCGEMARKLRFFKEQMFKAGVSPKGSTTQSDVNIDDIEIKLTEIESELTEMNANGEKLQRTYNELVEYKLVLQKAGDFFHSAQSRAIEQQREYESRQLSGESMEAPLLQDQELSGDSSKPVKLGFLAGLVPREKSMAFERILFRATRGNVFLRQTAVEDPVTDPVSGEKTEKNVFVVFYAGEKVKAKILKICDAFGANRYPFAEELGKQAQMISEVSGKLAELKTTIDAGLSHRVNLLENIGTQFEQWNLLVRKEKSIHHTLNMLSLDVTKKCLVAEGWSPVFATHQVQDALKRAAKDSNSQVSAILQVLHTRESPPTYFRTNKFTSSYQGIIDSYGVAKYQEANPTVFTVVTFPFLFAVMFGDWGHGICLLLAALYFIIREKKLSSQKLDDITAMTFGGRYVIFMMSLFSIYTGLIYNEFFSVPFELFGPSAYVCRDDSCRDSTTIGLIKAGPTYPFGVDPVWHGTRSELPFLNSLKMKMSILLGVAQMNLGIIMSYCNAKFFKNNVNVWFQFIPQVIFLNSLFGYLSLLIIVKWCTGSQADLYHVMIYMFLSPTDDLGENQLFAGQKNVQLVLLLLAGVAVPWMLLPKPFILKKQHEARHGDESYAPLPNTEESLQVESNHDSHGHGEFEFSEIFVHQLIHTIEFVLGAVSNTASYLRLWALSLAHSELSSVFYEKVLLMAWGYNNVVILIVGLIVFIFATVGVLLVMETLSAFLQNSKVQDLYYHCKNTFSPSGIPSPSSQALHKLSSILDTIKPVDVGLKEEAADDDRGLGFFGVNQLSRVARWAKPITYVDIHESDSFTMCMFCFPTSSVIPLHDHPGMTVFSKLLYGSLHVKAYDWVEPPCIVESKGPGHAQVRLAKLAVDKVLNAPCETSVLYPNRGGNIHCFTAVTPCAMLDVLAPPYKEYEGRKCTFYHDYPYSTFSAGNGSICDGDEDEYAWLAEVEPSNLYMNSGVYAGPAIKL